jgi:outer membrane protein OmpA-like peptidoglycan-associated protein
VLQYLVKAGIDATRLSAQGYGDTQPRADNATSSGRKQNRRIEVTAQ